MIAIDTETFLIERLKPFPQLVCITWCTATLRPGIAVHGDDIFCSIRDLLESDEMIVGHNIAYDMGVIGTAYPELLPLIFRKYECGEITDTMIRQKLWYIATGAVYDDKAAVKDESLAGLYEKYFKKRLSGKKIGEDSVRFHYADYFGMPLSAWPKNAIAYAEKDSLATYEIWEAQEKLFEGKIVTDTFEAYVAFCLALIASHGMVTDPDRVVQFKKELEAKRDLLVPDLMKQGFLKLEKKGLVKKRKTLQQRIAAACVRRGVQPRVKIDEKEEVQNTLFKKAFDGEIQTDKAAIYWAQDPDLLKMIEYSEVEKLLSTYVPFLEKGSDGPITTRFGLAATGRTTAGTPSLPMVGGPFQTMPRSVGVRECIVPRPGKVFLAGDFSGAEMHTLAQVCKWRLGFSVLGDALNKGIDPHLEVAATMMQIPYDEALARFKSGDPGVKHARQDAKPANFGFGGGMGVQTFIDNLLDDGVIWNELRGNAVKKAWLKTWSEMPKYFKSCSTELDDGCGVLTGYFSGMVRTVKGFSTCCNHHFQALTAVGAKLAVCAVFKKCYIDKKSALYGSRVCNFIHDELILEVSDNLALARAAALEFKKTMEENFNLVCSDYPTTVEVLLMSRWSKKAEPVYGVDGLLDIWTEKK